MAISDKDIEIIPPSRAVRAPRPATPVPVVDKRFTAPRRQNPGGLITSHPIRWHANVQARSYEALARRSAAERALVDADTELGHSLIKNARMRHEYAELPQTLIVDRHRREVKRTEEMRDLHHQVELAEARRKMELAEVETQVTRTHSDLTHARSQLTVARRTLLNAEQELEGQRQNGTRYHALGWEQRIGERELAVEEQRAILTEHRQRVADAQSRPGFAEDDLLARRAEFNADGLDTSAIDATLQRRPTRR
jgi:hypothetical protein